jgi:UDP-glucose 4-epimerase
MERKEVILITGGAGFIGTHLARALTRAGHDVISLDLKTQAPDPVRGVHYVTGDARNRMTISAILGEYRITAVYHLAATVSVPLCQKDVIESYSHNLNATLAVLEAIRETGRPVRLAFASSAALYGSLGDSMEPLSEERVSARFNSFYAAQKHASEKAIELYHEFHGIPSLVFRFFNVYGKGQDPTSPYSGVITIFTERARRNQPLTLYSAGVQTRDFIPVAEIARALASALRLLPEQWDATVMNLGTGARTSVRELAEVVVSITGSDSEIVDGPPREGDVIHSLANTERARVLLGFTASSDLKAGLAELLPVTTIAAAVSAVSAPVSAPVEAPAVSP